jgi:hypothetical protein
VPEQREERWDSPRVSNSTERCHGGYADRLDRVLESGEEHCHSAPIAASAQGQGRCPASLGIPSIGEFPTQLLKLGLGGDMFGFEQTV